MFNIIASEINPNAKATHRGQRFGDVKDSLADISAAKQYLNYSPEILFTEGLHKTINWFKK